MNVGNDSLLTISNLKTHFFFDEGVVKAVDDVSYSLKKGKTLGIVGESGCGKSVTVQSILNIVGSGGKIVSGNIYFRDNGEHIDLTKYGSTSEELRNIRGNKISMIFQEPMTAFSPVHKIGWQIIETLIYHTDKSYPEARTRVIDLLSKVGIPDPNDCFDKYPFELSGGMRQRAMIAMALACEPEILIADEPTTALDVTIQAQILELLKGLQSEFGMAILLISHNMGVIAEMADDVAVMYLGQIVEKAPVWELFENPSHPYTKALIKSIPKVEKGIKERLSSISGNVPDPYNLPKGCKFHPRCESFIHNRCNKDNPNLIAHSTNHEVRCFLFELKDE